MKFLIIVPLLTIFTASFGQPDKYLFERLPNETANDFVYRHLTDNYNMAELHPVLEGYWGDTSKGKKIMTFVDDCSICNENKSISLMVFQPVGDGKNYILITYNDLGGVGVYNTIIESLFYYDVDKNGSKELVIIQSGEVRVYGTIEDVDEDGNTVLRSTSSCCENIYDTVILEQSRDGTIGFLPHLNNITYDLNLGNMEHLKNADEVKKVLSAHRAN
ncbi:MAG: hypothetical protein N4A72_21125 [Bacteroidales bacterium]|jgi:hypothetical protein|nr:hypothetical protein [Bacteroidales bacterium]